MRWDPQEERFWYYEGREVPEHLREGLKLWIECGIPPGGFLMAVLQNDLCETFARGDDISTAAVRTIVGWLWNHAPMSCWGSKERVVGWAKYHQRSQS